MKKRLLLVVLFLVFTFSYVNAQYVVPKFTSTPPSSSNSSQSPQGTQLDYIQVRFGWNGNWTYDFYPNGSCYKHIFTKDSYDRIIEDKGQKRGSYTVYEDDYGVIRVYIRYDDGRKEQGILRYKSNRVEFSVNNKLNVDNFYK